MQTEKPPDVFISYRRRGADGAFETSYAALLFRMELIRYLGGTKVFQDVVSIGLGHDFERTIRQALQGVKLVFVLIDSTWAQTIREREERSEVDHVRMEIREILASEALVVPILLEGVNMPSPRDLPEDIRGITMRNGALLRASNWDVDFDSLLQRCSGVIVPTLSRALELIGARIRMADTNAQRGEALERTHRELGEWVRTSGFEPGEFMFAMQLVGLQANMALSEEPRVKSRRRTCDQLAQALGNMGVRPVESRDRAAELLLHIASRAEQARDKAMPEDKPRYQSIADRAFCEAEEVMG